MSLSRAIEAQFGTRFKVSGNPERPRRGAFVVSYQADNEKEQTVLFSKFETERFPTTAEVIQAIQQFEAEGTVPTFEPAVNWCTLL